MMAIFIGGSNDGVRIDVHAGRPTVCMPKPHRMDLRDFNQPSPAIEDEWVETYHRVGFGEIPVYLIEGMSIEQALDRLVERYQPEPPPSIEAQREHRDRQRMQDRLDAVHAAWRAEQRHLGTRRRDNAIVGPTPTLDERDIADALRGLEAIAATQAARDAIEAAMPPPPPKELICAGCAAKADKFPEFAACHIQSFGNCTLCGEVKYLREVAKA